MSKEINRNAVYEALLSNVKLKDSILNSSMKSRIESNESRLTTKSKVNKLPKQIPLNF